MDQYAGIDVSLTESSVCVVCVATEIGEDMLGRSERRLGIDDPGSCDAAADRCGEHIGVIKPIQLAGEA